MGIGVIMPKWLFYVLIAVAVYVAWTKFGVGAKLKG